MKIFKLYIQGQLLDVLTSKSETERCYLIPSNLEETEDESLRTKTEIKYIVVNKPMIEYFNNSLISKGKLKVDYTIDELYSTFKKTSIGNFNTDLNIKITPYSINEIKVELTIDSFMDNILDNLDENNKYMLIEKINTYVIVENIN
jgi:hypothetical protein